MEKIKQKISELRELFNRDDAPEGWMLSALERAVEVLERHTAHQECDDGWYSCPKSRGGCLNTGDGTECNCGADTTIKALADIQKLLCGEEK